MYQSKSAYNILYVVNHNSRCYGNGTFIADLRYNGNALCTMYGNNALCM